MEFKIILSTENSVATFLIRALVGVVFVSEGFQKFLFAAVRGAGRFEKIGLPAPEFLGPFVGSLEVLCGLLVLIGLVTRLASVPLSVIMLVALLTTKIPILFNDGFWEMMHASRTDWAMLTGSIFLLLKGGGKYSLDRLLLKEKNENLRK